MKVSLEEMFPNILGLQEQAMADGTIKTSDYVKDGEGNIWLVIGSVTDKDGERALLRPARPIVRFSVDPRAQPIQKPFVALTRLSEITVTEPL